MKEVQILPFIRDFVELLTKSVQLEYPEFYLTRTQKLWMSFCLTGILLTNTVCWARFERASFGGWLEPALSWMFRRSKIDWSKLLKGSIKLILKKYGIVSGSLELDDTDRERSKNAKQIYKLGKQKDKKSGGYFNGQSILMLLLVSKKISIPVGFEFYRMDPNLRLWQQEENRLKRKGVKKQYRPKRPERNSGYPTKNEIGLALIGSFKSDFGEIKIKAVKADALFGTSKFVDGVAALYCECQVISQIRSNQNIEVRGESYHVEEYFNNRAGIKREMVIRGGKKVPVYYSSVIGKVSAHGKKRLIIALKYEGEATYRYIIAQNMTWRVQDVLACFSLRWLVEVFFQDWKMYEGWGQLTKHVGEEGSRQSLILSLLFDHCLLSHPTQAARIKDNLPLYTVGSLRDRLSVESLMQVFKYILEQDDPRSLLKQLAEKIDKVYRLRISSKHLSGRKGNVGF
ncbi:MAG: transposase [Saprospiraceae bacterium]